MLSLDFVKNHLSGLVRTLRDNVHMPYKNRKAFQSKANCPLANRSWRGASQMSKFEQVSEGGDWGPQVNKFEEVLGWGAARWRGGPQVNTFEQGGPM